MFPDIRTRFIEAHHHHSFSHTASWPSSHKNNLIILLPPVLADERRHFTRRVKKAVVLGSAEHVQLSHVQTPEVHGRVSRLATAVNWPLPRCSKSLARRSASAAKEHWIRSPIRGSLGPKCAVTKFRISINSAVGMEEREKGSRIMKSTQQQTVRRGNLRRFPKFSIPPELLILREVKLLEMSDRFGPLSRMHPIIPQHRRD